MLKTKLQRKFLVLILIFWAGLASAALPNPAEFSWAVERNDLKQVKIWLNEGLDPEFQVAPLGSGLMIAAWYGKIEMMALFVEHGANPRRANKNGEQPLQLAAWNGHFEAAKWLLAHGALINRDGNYWSALHYAVFNGHQQLAEYLVANGAQINARSPNGTTPLMIAAREGREDAAKFLLNSGASTQFRNDWGDNALTMAMRYDHYRVGQLVSTGDEFASASKAPKESFGIASRSAAAPISIEDILKKMREAEAAGQATADLQRQLAVAIESSQKIKPVATADYSRRPMPLPYQPKSIVITAKRGQPGAERAQVISENKSTAKTAAKPAQFAAQAKIADLVHQIRLLEAQGQPADDLRQQLRDAVGKAD